MFKTTNIPHFWQKATFWAAATLISIVFANLLVTRFDQTLYLAATIILAILILKNLKLGIYIIIFLPVVGELIRLPFGPDNGMLVSDALIPILVAIWLIKKIGTTDTIQTTTPISKSPLFIPFILFIIVGGISLLQSMLFLDPTESLKGSLYLIRYFFYGLLYFITFQTVKSNKDFKNIITAIIISTFLIAIAGFIQLIVYPDLADLEEIGWDPHINRLVSTWLDPNFIGGLLAFISCILLGLTLHLKKLKDKIGISIIIVILVSALFLTFSRSAYLSFGAGLFVVSLLKSRKILIIALILAILGIATSDRARERTAELVQSVTAVFTETSQTPDPTAKLRIQSYQQTLYLIEKRPLLGSGYNNLRAVNHQEGFIKDPTIHSAGGSDSSLLTILATTGILGFIPFILLYLISLKTTYQNWRKTKSTRLLRGYNLGLLGGIFALLVHSLFVNSLLFSPILIFFWICLGLTRYKQN